MKKLLLSAFGILLLATNVYASGPEDNLFAKHFNQQNSIAIHGYDVVSYFKGAPQQGSGNFEVDYKDVIFQFVNQENANAFDSNPEKYLPAYGGWCATAMGMMNQKLDVTPDSYLIENGVLYLFSTSMGPAKDMWLQNQPGVKQKADENWAEISTR